MNPRPLDLEVLRNGRHEDTFQATGDPEDYGWLRRELHKWLTGHKQPEAKWPEFEMVARLASDGRQIAKVRA